MGRLHAGLARAGERSVHARLNSCGRVLAILPAYRRSSARGVRWPRAGETPAQLELAMVTCSRAPVDHHNHFGHDGTHDPKVTYVFDGQNQERIETIHTNNNRTLQEIISDTKFSVPHEDVSMKLHFLFGDSVLGGNSLFNWREEYWYYAQGDRRFALPAIERQVSFLYLQHLAVPRFMRYNLTNREDSVKIGSLKQGGGFHQEGLFGINIMGLRPGFVNKDAPVNEVAVVPNTFGNELAKNEAQYPKADA